jgi:excinuclease ABC subunit C
MEMAKDAPSSKQEFDWFGPSLITSNAIGEKTCIELPRDPLESRRILRTQCPTVPGVYGWMNADEQLIYVGKSKSLRHRLLSYFAKTPNDPKVYRIRRAASQLIWEPITHELLALLREQELIHRWRPEYNSQGQPTRRQPAYVCLSNSVASHAFVAKRLTEKVLAAFGPMAGTGHLQESVEALNHVFRLRDCPDKTKFEFGAQLTLFEEPPRAKCIRFELGSCPAPCARTCSASEYKSNLRRAESFLRGNDTETLPMLEQAMNEASRKWHFERAAILRNHWEALNRLDRQLKRFRWSHSRINGILTCPLSRGRNLWAVFRNGALSATIPEPRSERQVNEAIDLLRFNQTKKWEPSAKILDINLQLIVSSWFRKNIDDLRQLRSFADTLDYCAAIIERYRRSA